jgi:hypothetical protein
MALTMADLVIPVVKARLVHRERRRVFKLPEYFSSECGLRIIWVSRCAWSGRGAGFPGVVADELDVGGGELSVAVQPDSFELPGAAGVGFSEAVDEGAAFDCGVEVTAGRPAGGGPRPPSARNSAFVRRSTAETGTTRPNN